MNMAAMAAHVLTIIIGQMIILVKAIGIMIIGITIWQKGISHSLSEWIGNKDRDVIGKAHCTISYSEYKSLHCAVAKSSLLDI